MTRSWTGEADEPNAQFGRWVASAVDRSEGVIVVAPHHDREEFVDEGAAFLFLGSATGLESAAARSAFGGQYSAESGEVVASTGDVSSDGFDDVIVGVDGYNAGP